MSGPMLFHFSEDPSIAVFRPHVAKTREPDAEPLVWAVDAEHAPLYWFPRDCPRIALWRGPATTEDDAERFLGLSAAGRVHAIESGWLEPMRGARLFVYRFDPGPFELHEGDAQTGHYVSRAAVAPLGCEPMQDLLSAHAGAGIELRVTPSLWPLADALIRSTVRFSMSRMRNAAQR
ncbi:MAG: DUF6886 family protein [Candidatus Limnocylindria bacterium]